MFYKKKILKYSFFAAFLICTSALHSCIKTSTCVNIEGNIDDLADILGGGSSQNNCEGETCGCPSFAVEQCQEETGECLNDLQSLTLNFISGSRESCDTSFSIFDYISKIPVQITGTFASCAEDVRVAINCTGFVQIGIASYNTPFFDSETINVNIAPIYIERSSTDPDTFNVPVNFPPGTENPPNVAGENSRLVLLCGLGSKNLNCQSPFLIYSNVFTQICEI